MGVRRERSAGAARCERVGNKRHEAGQVELREAPRGFAMAGVMMLPCQALRPFSFPPLGFPKLTPLDAFSKP